MPDHYIDVVYEFLHEAYEVLYFRYIHLCCRDIFFAHIHWNTAELFGGFRFLHFVNGIFQKVTNHVLYGLHDVP
jgi:hypothetical protein